MLLLWREGGRRPGKRSLVPRLRALAFAALRITGSLPDGDRIYAARDVFCSW